MYGDKDERRARKKTKSTNAEKEYSVSTPVHLYNPAGGVTGRGDKRV